MDGLSWRQSDSRCPRLSALRLLEIPFWNFDGEEQRGELVVAAEVSQDILGVFAKLWHARFPIERMVRIDYFNADDERSMAANNCSGFCFRVIDGSPPAGGSPRLSMHALGLAVDINPVQNPYVTSHASDGKIFPLVGTHYLDRTDRRPGMIIRPSIVIDAFAAMGWQWGGDWTSKSDYHHFEPTAPHSQNLPGTLRL